MTPSHFELQVLHRIKLASLPKPEAEYKFHPTRKWRFDYAWSQAKVAVECEGGCWSRGRHTRGSGFIGDCAKYNEAAKMGWIVLRYTPDMIDNIVVDLKAVLTKQ